ncbi:MAG: ral secretion pathway protein, partial [Cyanobacteriota bacterium]
MGTGARERTPLSRMQTPGIETPAAKRSLLEDLRISTGPEPELDEQAVELLEKPAGSTASSPVISLVDQILIEALDSGASDIHVEPQEHGLQIRFRLDGVLQKQFDELPKNLIPAITSRIKIMADLDIAERRLPQDGRIRRIY